MAVDRGGLNYPITVSYVDRTPIQDFKKDVDAAKASWDAFKKSLSAAKASVTLPTPGAAPGGGGGGGGSPAPAPAASPRPAMPGAPPPAGATRSWGDFFKTLIGGSNDSNRAANQLINTFERLFARVVIIGAIRKAGSEFAAFVGEMINFNATMEQSILGISSLLLALGHFKDATGEDTNNIRSFALANAEATKQVAQLRVDALQSASTFENLAKTFQTALAPGLQAGLNLDEIRKLTIQISQAAAAIGLPQNQLAEEIRSLLAGTINARNTRIATSLGISNDDIRRAKEAGTLIEFLTEKFSAFDTAGKAALGTFTVLLSNLKDAFQQIIGGGGAVPFFETLKVVMKELQGVLFTVNTVAGKVEPNPKAVYIVKQLSEFLTDALLRTRALVQEFGFEGLLGAAQGIVIALRLVFDIVLGSIQGTIAAFKDIGAVLNFLSETFKYLFGFDLAKSLNIVQLVAGFVEFQLVLFAVKSAWSGIISVVSGLWTILSAIGLQMAVLVVLTALLAEGTRQYAGYMAGAEVSWTALGGIIVNNIAGAMLYVYEYTILIFENIWAYIKIGFLNVTDFIQTTWSTVIGFIKTTVIDFVNTMIDGVKKALDAIKAGDDMANKIGAGMPAAARSALDNLSAGVDAVRASGNLLAAANDAITASAKRAHDERLKGIQEQKDQLAELNRQSTERIAAIATNIADSNDTTIKENKPGTLLGGAKDAIDALRNAMSGLGSSTFGKFPADLGKVTEDARTLSKTFEDLPGILSPTLESIKAQAKVIHELSEAAVKANKELVDGLAVLGLSGVVLQQRKNIFEGETKEREKQKALLIDQKSQQETLNGIIVQRARLEEKIALMGEEQRAIILQADVQAREDQKRREKLAELMAEEGVLYIKLDDAKRANDPAQIKAIEEKIEKTKELIDAEKDEIFLLGLSADEQLKGMTVDETREITETVSKRVLLSGQQKAVEERLAELAKEKLKNERLINQAVDDKNNLLARQSVLELKNSNELAAIQAANDRATFNTRFSLPEVTSLVNARDALTLLSAQIGQAQRLRQLAIDHLSILIEQNKARLDGLIIDQAAEKNADERNRMGKQIESLMSSQNGLVQERNQLIEQNTIKLEQETLQLQKASDAAEHARNVIERPLSTGFLDGVRKAAQELPSLYQGTVNLIKSIVSGLTDFISTSIVDAFDPTKKQDIVERFARFLQQIAKQVLDMFIHLAFVKAVLGLGFLGEGGVPGGGLPSGGLGLGFLGLAEGGMIPHAQGLAGGGYVRPKGLDPRDTTPIWAQPGEFMQPVAAVARYGGDVMEKIRRGLIDPYSLRTLASMTKLDRSSVSPRIGAVANSLITARRQNVTTQTTGAVGAQQPGVVQAVVVANDQHLDRLLAGGKTSFFNFFEKNKSKLRGILNT